MFNGHSCVASRLVSVCLQTTVRLRPTGYKMKSVKCVVVGEIASGKTVLLIRYTTKTYPSKYIPSVFDPYSVHVTVDDTLTLLELHDAMGTRGDYDRLRYLCFAKTDVFLICFDLTDRSSYESIRHKWYPDVRKHRPKTPIILVGTKLDLREDDDGNLKDSTSDNQSITYAQGQSLQSEIGAVSYMECSSLTGKGVNEVFEEAIRIVSIKRQKKRNAVYCRPQEERILLPGGNPPSTKSILRSLTCT